MADAAPGDYPPPPPPAARPVWSQVAGRCCPCGCVLIVLLAAWGVVTFRSGMKSVKAADPVAQQFIQLITAGKLDEAYALCSTPFKQSAPKEEFQRFARAWREMEDDVQSMSQTGWNWRTGTGGSFATLTYDVRGRKRTANVQITLIEETGVWRVSNANINNSRPSPNTKP